MRGHLVVLGGSRLTGAARLVSEAAMRIGAGLCSIVAPAAACIIYREAAPHVMVEELQRSDDFSAHLSDPKRTAFIIGPGADTDNNAADLRTLTLTALASGRPCVIDAAALSAFGQSPATLLASLNPARILTPHEGEFSRLFPDISLADRIAAAHMAAIRANAIIVLKGAETVVAHPDGRDVINTHATPDLATAGAGDVLAGMIGGLLAQGMDPFQSACAAVWMHGDIARDFGAGLVAPDIIAGIPAELKKLGDLARLPQ
jgi:NAD(P)H-hydrate epimerase